MTEKKSKPVLLRIDDVLRDLDSEVPSGASAEEVSALDPQALDVFRHSCSHLLAQAVTHLFPNAKYGIGPAVENGFYYDFLVDEPFSPEDLVNISKRMKFLIKQNLKIEKKEWTRAEAIDYFKSKNQDLKVQLIEEKVDGDTVSVYQQGDFVDLCRGPHVPSLSYLKNFKLTSVAAAYWKGDENSFSMQRIYGVVFPTREQLDAHLHFLQEAKKRDHRKLGRDLDLFSIQNEVGAGLVLWHPKGSVMRHEIEDFWRQEHFKRDYELLFTPHIARYDLWETSGHSGFYSQNMFTPIEFDNTSYQLKPMNCPFHIVVFKSRNRSYRDLPLRWAELGTVYRYERSGVLHGLMRVRGFTQDDAHIFCTPDQMQDEVGKLITFSLEMLKTFGFKDLDVYLSTRPEKYVGELSDWDLATGALTSALNDSGVKYQIDSGEGVFYGPKIDIKVKDVLGRSWQCTTIQVDFQLPKRFNLKYSDNQGNVCQPIMIHRALLGSLERFFGILVEHYGGFFPVWLAPVQAVVIPINDRNAEYAQKIYAEMKAAGIRVQLENRSEGMGKKIRDAEIQKIPYILIVGDEEEKDKNASLRIHKQGDKGKVEIKSLIDTIRKLVEEKSSDYEKV